MMIMQFSQFPFLYNEEWSFSMIFGKMLNGLFCFAILTILSMIVTYIAMIRGRMSKLIVENLNLLDKMHEGLIVLSESDKSIQLASKPAVYLLKQLPQVDTSKIK